MNVQLLLANALLVHALAAQNTELTFGHYQVEQIICDRPAVGRVILQDPELRRTLELHFAWQSDGTRVYWDNQEPTGPQPAEHMGSTHDYPALVRVSQKPTAVDQCTMLLLELYNFEVDREYETLVYSTPKARKSEQEFAEACVRLEYRAANRARDFFWRRPIKDVTIRDSYYFGLLASTTDTDEIISRFFQSTSRGYNPIDYYRGTYDSLIRAEKKQQDAAARLKQRRRKPRPYQEAILQTTTQPD